MHEESSTPGWSPCIDGGSVWHSVFRGDYGRGETNSKTTQKINTLEKVAFRSLAGVHRYGFHTFRGRVKQYAASL